MPNSYEHSYQHDLDNVVDASDAVLAIGTEKVSTTTLKDRALSNDATIHETMPSNGYFLGRRFTAANSNYLDCGNDSSLDLTNALTIAGLIKTPDLAAFRGIIAKKTGAEWKIKGYSLNLNTTGLINFVLNDKESISSSSFDDNKLHLTACTWEKGGVLKIFVSGQEVSYHTQETLSNDIISSTDNLKIGVYHDSSYIDGIIILTHLGNIAWSTSEIEHHFNTLARLTLYSHNFERYPNSDTSITSVFPYTSGIITSGAFNKTDGLKCTSVGQIIFSNSFEFDGSEYITLVINGVKYSGTTTVTQGTITATIAQGSNDITIDMGTNDVLEDICVQFREEV